MIGVSENLLVYYLGLGFATLLAWPVFSPEPGHRLGRRVAARYLRWAPLAGVVAVLHPALAFAIRDIVGQVGIELPEDRELAAKHARVTGVVNAFAVMSLVVLAAVLIIDIGL